MKVIAPQGRSQGGYTHTCSAFFLFPHSTSLQALSSLSPWEALPHHPTATYNLLDSLIQNMCLLGHNGECSTQKGSVGRAH